MSEGLKLGLPWLTPGKRFRNGVVLALERAGFPRFASPVRVLVNVHPPVGGKRVDAEKAGELVSDCLVEFGVAFDVAEVRVVVRGAGRGGFVSVIVEEAK